MCHGWSHFVLFLTVQIWVSPILAMNGFAFQNGTSLTWNSDLPSGPAGGSVNSTFTGVAPASDGTAISRWTAGNVRFGSVGSLLNAIVNTSSGMRNSTLPYPRL